MSARSGFHGVTACSVSLRLKFVVMALAAWHGVAGAAADEARIDLQNVPLETLLTLEVYGASKFAQKVSEAPSAVTVVTAAEIKAFGWRTLADILRSVRGLHVSDDRNYSYLGAQGFLRPGDYNTRFLLLVDGYRTNDAVFDQASIGQEFILDVDLIDRVEYVSGPGSSIYGANAFFGVINVITKRGGDIGGSQLAIDAGSFGRRQARATYGRRIESGTEFLLSASTYRSDGQDLYYQEFDTPQDGSGVARGVDSERAQRFLAKVAHGPFDLALAHAERIKGVPTASYGQVFSDPRSRTTDTQTFLKLGYRNQIADGVEFNAQVFAGRYSYAGDFVYDQPSNHVLRDGADARWHGGELKWVVTRFDRHKIVAGAESQSDNRRDQYYYSTGPADSQLTGEAFDDHRRGRHTGIYLQDEFALRDDLLINAGVRHDTNPEIGGVTNPRLALIYKWRTDTTAKLLYGTAFRAPNSYEMYYVVSGPGGQLANPSLQAEHIRTRELVLEHHFSPESRLTAQVYHNTVSNLISLTAIPVRVVPMFHAPSSVTPGPGNGLLQFQNIDTALARGVALEFERLWSNGARLRSSVSLQRTVDRSTNAELENAPRRLAKFNLSLPLPYDAWRAAIEAHYVGRRKTLQADVAGYWLANLSLFSARLAPGAELTASIYNLFDRRYADPGSEEHVQDTIAQDGRTFRIKLSYAF